MAGFFGLGSNNNEGNQNNDASNNQNSNNKQNENSNNENNNENNGENNTSIWDNKQTENNSTNQNNQNGNNQNNNSGNPDAASMFAKHVADLNLTNGIDVSKIQSDLANGETGSLQEAFASISANTYQAAMTQMNRLVDNKVNSAVEKSVSESGSMMNENLAIREMNDKMPFTTDKNIAPVANAALKNLMSQGDSASVAMEKVQAFFKNTADMVSNANGSPDSGAPGRNGFNRNNSVSNNSNNNNSNGEDDWIKTLSQ